MNSNCTKRNPEPPCQNGYYPKLTKKNINCCYKEKTKKKCSKRNPEPPCKNGYYSKYNKTGDQCCYKDQQSIIHRINKFSIISDIKIELDIARNIVRFIGNTFPIKDKIKEACRRINQKPHWDSLFKTWSAPFDIIFNDHLKDVVNINYLPKLDNMNLILGEMITMSRYSINENKIQSIKLYGETNKIRELIYFYGGYHLHKKPYTEDLLKDKNIDYWEFGSDISPFNEKNLQLFREIFNLNNIIKHGFYGRAVSNKYLNLYNKQEQLKKKQEEKYKKYRDKIRKSYEKVTIKKIDMLKDKRGYVLSINQIITGPEKYVRMVYNDILSQYCFIGYGTRIINEKYISKRPKILQLTLDRSTTTGD